MMKKAFRSRKFTIFLLVLAMVMLAIGSIGITMAALNVFSGTYNPTFRMSNAGATLLENGSAVAANGASGDIIKGIVKDGESFQVGREYPVELKVQNTGAIPEYVRVSVYKYWIDPSGTPLPNGWVNGEGGKLKYLDPDLIEVKLNTSGGWTVDTAATTKERTVLYYSAPLAPGESSTSFAQSVKVNGDILKFVTVRTETADGKTVSYYEYAYDGLSFAVEVQADTVQAKHGDDARTSAWGHIGANS